MCFARHAFSVMRISDLHNKHYTASEAARLLGIDRSTIREHCQLGRIKTVQVEVRTTRGVKKRTRIHWSELAAAARRLGYLEVEG